MSSTDKQSLMKPSAVSRTFNSLEQVKENALAVRTIAEALNAPTVAQTALRHGQFGTSGMITAVIHQGMELFALGRRLTPGMVGMVAEMMMGRYKHESVADLSLFLRKCAAGEYDEGKTYGSLDIPLLIGWFTKYLEEKAIIREQEAGREEHVIEQRMRQEIGDDPVLMKALKTSVENFSVNTAAKREAQRRERLKKDLEFTDRLKSEDPANEEVQDVLVRLYQLHGKALERNMILQECDRRGIDRFVFMERVKVAPTLDDMAATPLAEDGTDQ